MLGGKYYQGLQEENHSCPVRTVEDVENVWKFSRIFYKACLNATLMMLWDFNRDEDAGGQHQYCRGCWDIVDTVINLACHPI